MGPAIDELLGTLLIVLLILVVAFLILREFFCWYWKVNKLVDLQEKQNELLEELSTHLKNGGALHTEGHQSSERPQAIDEDRSDKGDDDIARDNLFK